MDISLAQFFNMLSRNPHWRHYLNIQSVGSKNNERERTKFKK